MAGWTLSDISLEFVPEITRWLWKYIIMPSIIPLLVVLWGKIKAKWSWPAVVAVLIVLYAAALYISNNINIEDSKETKPKIEEKAEISLKQVVGKSFRNEKIILDGYSYIDCTFTNVTIVYDGGPYNLIGNTFYGGRILETNNPDISEILKLAKMLGIIDTNLYDKDN